MQRPLERDCVHSIRQTVGLALVTIPVRAPLSVQKDTAKTGCREFRGCLGLRGSSFTTHRTTQEMASGPTGAARASLCVLSFRWLDCVKMSRNRAIADTR